MTLTSVAQIVGFRCHQR